MKAATLRTLRAIDWDFAVPRSGYVGPPHWYPGTFVPALSDALIEALTPEGGLVFDPYGGIGTTAWSALRAGRSSQVCDINPVAVLAAYATTSLLSLARIAPARANAVLGELGRTLGRNDDLFGQAGIRDFSQSNSLVNSLPAPEQLLSTIVVGPPNWAALQPWIAPETLIELQQLIGAIGESENAYVRLLGMCMISAIARSVNSQHASWGHIADNVRPREMKTQSVHAASTRWLKKTKAFVMQPMVETSLTSRVTAEVHRRDWSRPGAAGPGTADLLLTSPPYADAIDYTLAQRLSLYLMGYDEERILALVSGEIGARRKRFKSVSRTQWSEQLCSAMTEQLTWLKPDAAVCLILPHRDSGRSAGEDDLKAVLHKNGWRMFFEQDRSIHQSFTRQSWTSIKRETIVAFAAS